MKKKNFLFVIFIVLPILFLFISISKFVNAEQTSQNPLSILKNQYFVNDEIEINVNIDASNYPLYELVISSSTSSKQYRYKGEFNQVMFFYPTVEDIYTAALVEKATGATYYQLAFNVQKLPINSSKNVIKNKEKLNIPVNSSKINNSQVNGSIRLVNSSLNRTNLGVVDNLSSLISNNLEENDLINKATNFIDIQNAILNYPDEDKYRSPEKLRRMYESAFYLEKDEYQYGELVSFRKNPEFFNDTSNLRLFNLHNGVINEYKGTIDRIDFIPNDVGSYELIIIDQNNLVLSSYSFIVVDDTNSFNGLSSKIPKQKKLLRIKNSKGDENTFDLKIFDNSNKIIRESDLMSLSNTSATKREKFKIEISPSSSANIKNIELREVELNSSNNLEIGLDEFPKEEIKLRGKKLTNAYAIDPSQVSFQSGTLNAIATGDELWKCKDWNFNNRICNGEWIKVMNLNRGQTYSVELSASDPAFIEIISISSALHLDQNRNLIEDISPEVITRDGVFKSIPANDFVRVFFEQNLTSDRDITIYAKSNSTNATVIVYSAGQTTPIAIFPKITIDQKYKILLTNLLNPEDSFDLQVISSDGQPIDFDFIVDPLDTLPAGTREGMLVYGENGATAPRYRFWDGTQFGPELNATDIGATVEWVRMRSSPINYEYLMGSSGSANDVNVQIYSYVNSTTACWHNETFLCDTFAKLTTTSATINQLKLDVGYEQLSGRGMIVYVDVSTNPDVFRYRIWNGSAFSAQTTIPQTQLAGNAESIKLVERPNSNEIAVVLTDSNDDADVMIWNGTGWNCEPGAVLTANLATNVFQKADLVYEQLSGDLFVALSEFTQTQFLYTEKPADTCSFSTSTTSVMSIQTDQIQAESQRGSDYVLITTRENGANDMNAIAWNGTQIMSGPSLDLSNYAETSPNNIIGSAWAGSSETGIALYSDSINTGLLDYMLYNKTSDSWLGNNTGLHTPGLGTPTNFNGGERNYATYSYLDEDKLLLIVQDDANFLWAKIFDDATKLWTDADGGVALENQSIAGTIESQNFDFAWNKVQQKFPLILFVPPTDNSSIFVSRNYTNINVTANDTNFVNLTLFFYNSTFDLINITNTTSNFLYRNFTDLTDGIYYYNATACDSVDNCNWTETRNITLDTVFPYLFFNTPTDNGTYVNRTYIMINVSVNETNLNNFSLNFYNSSAILVNQSNATIPSQNSLYLNITNLTECYYYFNASACDLAGKCNYTRTYNITVDLYNPQISYLSLTEANGSFINRNYIHINASANDTFLSDFRIQVFTSSNLLADELVSTTSGILFLNSTGKSEGLYYFNASVCDSTGKCNRTATRNVTIDLTYPSVYYNGSTEISGLAANRTNIYVNSTGGDLYFQNLTINLYDYSRVLLFSISTNQTNISVNFTSLNEGMYFFNATACDVAQNCNTTNTRNFTLDFYGPTINLSAPTEISGDVFNRSYIQINASANDTNLRNITINIYNQLNVSVAKNISYNQPNFFWNATGFGAGTYFFNATVCDALDQCANTETRNVTVFDDSAPTINFTTPTDINDTTLNRGYILINVTAIDPAIANITIFIYNSTGLFKINITTQTDIYWNATGMPNGMFYFNATACDTSDQCNSTETRNVTIFDLEFPTIQFNNPTETSGNYIARDYINVNVSASDSNLKNLTIYFYNSTRDLINNSYTEQDELYETLIGLTEGLYFFNATACDLADNCVSTQTRNVTIDLTGPNLTLLYPRNFENITDSVNFTVNATVNDTGIGLIDSVIFEFRFNSTSNWLNACNGSISFSNIYECTWNTTLLVDSDTYQFRVLANDTLGNDAIADVHTNITLDSLPPIITIISPENNSIDGDGDILFTYSVNDLGSSILNCTLFWQETTNQTQFAPIIKQQEYVFSIINLTNGNYNWSIQCVDSFNHESSSGKYNLSVDLVYFMGLNVTPSKQIYENGSITYEPIQIYTTSLGLFGSAVPDVNITTDLVKLDNLTEPVAPWWNISWNKRKPIYLSTTSLNNVSNAAVIVNVTNLAGNITNCTELRVVDNNLDLTISQIIDGDNNDYCEISFLANVTANTTNFNNYFVYYNNSGVPDVSQNIYSPDYFILFEDFEGGGWTQIASNNPATQCDGGFGNFNGCINFTTSMDFSTTTATGAPISGTRILTFDQSNPFAADQGIYESFNSTSICGGDQCDDINVNGYIAASSLDNAGEFALVWARNDSTTSFTPIYQCQDGSTCEFSTGDVAPSILSNWTYFNSRLNGDLGIGLTEDMYVHIALVGSQAADNAFFEDINITGVRKQAPNITAVSVGSAQKWISRKLNLTDAYGFSNITFNTSILSYGNYSAVSRGVKELYNVAFNYTLFEVRSDKTPPISTLIKPGNNENINGIDIGFNYLLNATVSDISNVSVYFEYRYNSTSPWNLICNIHDESARPSYTCNWNLITISSGSNYEIRVYANDTFNNLGSADNHSNINITINNPLNVTSVVVDDDISIPINEIDLIAADYRNVFCNVSVKDALTYIDVLGVNATLYSSSVNPGDQDNPRNHYANSSCTQTYAFENDSQYICGFQVNYYAINGSWSCLATAIGNYSIYQNFDTVSVNQLFALNISTEDIDYNQLPQGQISGDIVVNVTNIGNVPMNLSVFGFGGENESLGQNLSYICELNNINISSHKFSTSILPYGSKVTLSSTPTPVGLTIPPQLNSTDLSKNSTYWQLQVPPTSQAFGNCNGSLVFMATPS